MLSHRVLSSGLRKKLKVQFFSVQSLIHLLTLFPFSSSELNDLQKFVNISLATAAGGEDAYTHDKLSNLRTVGSGFEALIYRLPSDAGYQTLVDRCKTLWETLRSAPNLPDMMVQ